MRTIIAELFNKVVSPMCVYCGVPLNKRLATRDHYIPHAMGGKGAENYKWACVFCNAMKRDFHPEFFKLQVKSIYNHYCK